MLKSQLLALMLSPSPTPDLGGSNLRDLLEQIKNEFDETDGKAFHLVMYDNNIPVGCCRFFSGDNEGEYILGRLAVRKQYRGKAMGQRIMEKAMDYMRSTGVKRLSLSSQVQAKGFYETLGFVAEGEEYLDEHCPHIHMVKELVK